MIEEGMLLPINFLPSQKTMMVTEPKIFLVHYPENMGTCLSVTGQNYSVAQWEIQKNSLIFLDRVVVRVEQGHFVYRAVRMDTMAKLLAFVDMSRPESQQSPPVPCFFEYGIDDSSFFCTSTLAETWFLTACVKNEEWFRILCQLLRRTETYSLVKYLVAETTSHTSLNELCQSYGLSYSHFRRVCRNALGGKVKAEICHWRLARAVLEVLEGKTDITTIAYKYGYSSSSHFSAEVKAVMGKTLREMRHILYAV